MSERVFDLLIVVLPVAIASGGIIQTIIERLWPKKTEDKILEVVESHTSQIKEIKDKVDLLGDESLETLRRILKNDYKKYKSQGFWSSAQKAQWIKNFSTYTALGGNGEIRIYNDELMKLEVRD